MDSPAEKSFDRLTRLGAALLRAPICLVSLVDDRREFFKSEYGLPAELAHLRELPIDQSFCRHVVETSLPWRIEDLWKTPAPHPVDTARRMGVRAYLGIPLKTADGEVVGSLCVLDRRPRHWTSKQVSALEDLGASVTSEIELRCATIERHEANEVLIHDLKNPLSAVLLLAEHMRRASHQAGDPDTEKRVSRIRSAAQRMQNVISSIVYLNRSAQIDLSLTAEAINLRALVEETLESTPYPDPALSVEIESSLAAGDASVEVYGPRDQLKLALTNLLTAAMEISLGRGTIKIGWLNGSKGEEFVGLRILIGSGNATSLPESEMAHLFEPYLGPGTILRKGTKLGLCLSREILLKHGGDMSITQAGSRQGTYVELRLDLPTPQGFAGISGLHRELPIKPQEKAAAPHLQA